MSEMQGEIHVNNNLNYIVSEKSHENAFDFCAFVYIALCALFLLWLSCAVFNCLYMVCSGLKIVLEYQAKTMFHRFGVSILIVLLYSVYFSIIFPLSKHEYNILNKIDTVKKK